MYVIMSGDGNFFISGITEHHVSTSEVLSRAKKFDSVSEVARFMVSVGSITKRYLPPDNVTWRVRKVVNHVRYSLGEEV